ncbi:MAG: DUF4365 domain-containing protein [Bacteroidetes bacterium]|nr:DUF4365 domain-containing protein [Bacteroidota bacterium]
MNAAITRLKIRNEATGVRVVAQTVQEHWECGWQEHVARNDKGIDGVVIMKHKGVDYGVNVNVQVKCGAGYISSIKDNNIRISIDDAVGLAEHIKRWKMQNEPVVLVFVNPSKLKRDKNGNIIKDKYGRYEWVEDRKNSKAWWVNLKSEDIYPDNTKTIIEISKEQTFGEHSKKDFVKLIEPYVRSKELQQIVLNNDSEKLLLVENLKQSARAFYTNWRNTGGSYCKALNLPVIISRLGWIHIKHSRRGRVRRIISMKHLGAAKQIIEECETCNLISQIYTVDYIEQKYLLRARVKGKTGDNVLQVILIKRKKLHDNTVKCWFYSVHNRK